MSLPSVARSGVKFLVFSALFDFFNSPPVHFLTLLQLELVGPNDLNAILAHQSTNPGLADALAQFVQLLRHAGPDARDMNAVLSQSLFGGSTIGQPV